MSERQEVEDMMTEYEAEIARLRLEADRLQAALVIALATISTLRPDYCVICGGPHDDNQPHCRVAPGNEEEAE